MDNDLEFQYRVFWPDFTLFLVLGDFSVFFSFGIENDGKIQR